MDRKLHVKWSTEDLAHSRGLEVYGDEALGSRYLYMEDN